MMRVKQIAQDVLEVLSACSVEPYDGGRAAVKINSGQLDRKVYQLASRIGDYDA